MSFFDTNVYICAFVIPGSLSDEASYRARVSDVDLYTSVAILTELVSKLCKKFGWNEERIRMALKSISRTAQVVKTTPHLAVVRDGEVEPFAVETAMRFSGFAPDGRYERSENPAALAASASRSWKQTHGRRHGCS